MIADFPFGRRKAALFGLMPSAMYATLTPRPSIPSAAAVRALLLLDRTFRVCRASGSSTGFFGFVEQAWGFPLAGAAGIAGPAAAVGAAGADAVAFGVTVVRPLGAAFAVAEPVAPAPEGAWGGATETEVSGTTLATAGSAARAFACAAVTVAAKALPVAECVTLPGAAPLSRPSTARWAAAVALVRPATCAASAGAEGTWSRRTMI